MAGVTSHENALYFEPERWVNAGLPEVTIIYLNKADLIGMIGTETKIF